MENINPLALLFEEFLREYRKHNNGIDNFLFYFEMSKETLSSLCDLPRLVHYKIEQKTYNFNIPNKIVIGRLFVNTYGYWQIPIVEAPLPKGKVFLRKTP